MELPALKKLSDTVKTIIEVAEKVPTLDEAQLSQAEMKVRNEFQVIEAHIIYVGQEFYRLVQARRQELRRTSYLNTVKALDSITEQKEEDGTRDSGTDRDSRVGDGTNESSGAEQQSDKQTRKPARQSRRKK